MNAGVFCFAVLAFVAICVALYSYWDLRKRSA